jgi:GNAT superfamily N-acetyltransferase
MEGAVTRIDGKGQAVADDPAMTVRRAEPDDADDLGEVHVRAWQAGYLGMMPAAFLESFSAPERAGWWRRNLSEPSTLGETSVAVIGSRVVGFAVYGDAREQPEPLPDIDAGATPTGELYALNVHPDHWSGGVGSALIADAHAGLTAAGHRNALLWVVRDNARARVFYERRGWSADGVEHVRDLQGATVPEVRYTRTLP